MNFYLLEQWKTVDKKYRFSHFYWCFAVSNEKDVKCTLISVSKLHYDILFVPV